MNVVRATLALGILVAAVGAFAACSPGGDSGGLSSRPSTATILEVRGVIRQLPRQAAVPLLIEHEAIPDFIDIDGNRAPMGTMTMPFAVADDVSLDGLEVGDPIGFTLEIDWQTTPSIVVTSVEALTEGTRLEIGDSDYARQGPDETVTEP